LIHPSLFGLIVFLSACNLKISHDQDKYSSARTDTVQIKSQADSLEELSKLYTRAIRDFLRASENEYRLHFDTLYIGKHVYGQPDDFPDIDLPAMIDSTIIRIIAPEDGIRIQRERKNEYYVNIFSWIQDQHAEFVLVSFANGMQHQFDLKVRYSFDRSRRNIHTDNLHFEHYLGQMK